MYADRYGNSGIKPGALSIAIALNGAVLAALIFSSPDLIPKFRDPRLTMIDIKVPPDPPPLTDIKPKPETKILPDQKTFTPPPPERPVTFDPPVVISGGYVSPSGPSGAIGGVTGGTGPVVPFDPPKPAPVIIGSQLDPRYANAFQPAYPPSEIRAGNTGKVRVRVLIGVDGRVKQVEMVSAASDAFFAATRKQALEKWRFKPATRDGIPQEEWRTMNVTFVLNDDR